MYTTTYSYMYYARKRIHSCCVCSWICALQKFECKLESRATHPYHYHYCYHGNTGSIYKVITQFTQNYLNLFKKLKYSMECRPAMVNQITHAHTLYKVVLTMFSLLLPCSQAPTTHRSQGWHWSSSKILPWSFEDTTACWILLGETILAPSGFDF